MAAYLTRTEGVYVSYPLRGELWRASRIKPHRSGTFTRSRDLAFAEKVADVIGLYLDPPGGAVVLSIDEKTGIQALDRTQPLLPIAFDVTGKRTHDYVRHGTTNLFAALNVTTGEVFGQRTPTRHSADFLAFLRQAVTPTPARTSTSSWTTSPPTKTPKSGPGCRTRRSASTSPPSARRGSTRSRSGSESSPASPSAAAPSPPSPS